jgi:transcriptional regulator of heat shock response
MPRATLYSIRVRNDASFIGYRIYKTNMVDMNEDESDEKHRTISAQIPEPLYEELENLNANYGITKASLVRRGVAEQVEKIKG